MKIFVIAALVANKLGKKAHFLVPIFYLKTEIRTSNLNRRTMKDYFIKKQKKSNLAFIFKRYLNPVESERKR